MADNQKKIVDLTARLEQSKCIERIAPVSLTRRDDRDVQRGYDLSRDQEVLDLLMAGEYNPINLREKRAKPGRNCNTDDFFFKS